MRRNHTREYRRGKRTPEHYSIEYFRDPSRSRLRQIIDDARKTIYINADADMDADESQHIGTDGRRRTL